MNLWCGSCRKPKLEEDFEDTYITCNSCRVDSKPCKVIKLKPDPVETLKDRYLRLEAEKRAKKSEYNRQYYRKSEKGRLIYLKKKIDEYLAL